MWWVEEGERGAVDVVEDGPAVCETGLAEAEGVEVSVRGREKERRNKVSEGFENGCGLRRERTE